jgi:hypothetical protein
VTCQVVADLSPTRSLPVITRAHSLVLDSAALGGVMSTDPGGVVTTYQSDGLRGGGGLAIEAGGVAERAAGVLRAVMCSAGAFGAVAGAAELATAVGRARDAYAGTGTAINTAHMDLDARSRQVATQGDGLAVQTAAVARTGGAVVAGMS